MEQFHHLKQTSSVSSYIDTFEEYMIQMRRDHPYLTEHFFLLRFISGLKDSVKHLVKSHQPATLKAAYWQARQQEQAYLSLTKKPPQQQVTRQPTGLQAKQNSFLRDHRPRPMVDKPKEPRKCWYCPEPWSLGHKCQTVKNILHAIHMQGHSEEDEAVKEH